MTKENHIHDMESDPTDVRGRFREIRETLEQAETQEELTELYKRSVFMILMTHSTPLDEKADPELKRRRETTEKEFARTVRMINRRAKKIGAEADFSEDWRQMETNHYETEAENLLEAQREAGIVREQND
jgi:predicted DsbA family dithiol-disulfide isomerase